MNEQIERHLEAEAEPDSQGYFTDRPIKKQLLVSDGGPPQGPAAQWSAPADADVAPLSSVAELLDLARAQPR